MNETQYLYIFILWLLSALLLRSLLTTKSKPPNLPPSPPSLPVIGHLHHLFTAHIHESFHRLSALHGPLLYLRLGSSDTILVSSAELAALVFKTHDLSFSSRPTFSFADKILYGSSGFINAPYGDYWRFMKKLCVTELLAPRQVDRSRSIRRDELRKFLTVLMARADTHHVADVGAELVRLTNNFVCRTSMSTSCSDDVDEAAVVRQLVKESFELAGKLYLGEMVGPLRGLVLWRYGKLAADMTTTFDALMERIVKEHEQRLSSLLQQSKSESESDHHKDLMDMVLEVYRDDNGDVKITRDNVKAFFVDLIVAGTDTSSQTMQWVLAELINHQTVLKKVEEEIEQALAMEPHPRLIQESDIPNLPYMTAVIKETLRLHPPGPVTTRLCREPCNLGGYDIPQGTPVAVNLYTIMRDPSEWEDPDEFRPERFLMHRNDDVKGSVKFIPFGAGRRGCPGTHMAYALMVPVLAATVQCFDWKTMAEEGDGDGDNCKVNMKPRNGLSLGMANSIKCVPRVRFNPFV